MWSYDLIGIQDIEPGFRFRLNQPELCMYTYFHTFELLMKVC